MFRTSFIYFIFFCLLACFAGIDAPSLQPYHRGDDGHCRHHSSHPFDASSPSHRPCGSLFLTCRSLFVVDAWEGILLCLSFLPLFGGMAHRHRPLSTSTDGGASRPSSPSLHHPYPNLLGVLPRDCRRGGGVRLVHRSERKD